MPYTEVFIDILVASMKEGDGILCQGAGMQMSLALLLKMSARAICPPAFGYDLPRMDVPPGGLGSSRKNKIRLNA